MLLSNAYSNRLDKFINSFSKKDVIIYYQTKNAISPQLPSNGRNGVAGHFEIEEGATGRNKIAGYSKKGERMVGINRDMSEVCFLDWKIIKYNWQKDKTLNPRVDKERLLLTKKTLKHTSSDN